MKRINLFLGLIMLSSLMGSNLVWGTDLYRNITSGNSFEDLQSAIDDENTYDGDSLVLLDFDVLSSDLVTLSKAIKLYMHHNNYNNKLDHDLLLNATDSAYKFYSGYLNGNISMPDLQVPVHFSDISCENYSSLVLDAPLVTFTNCNWGGKIITNMNSHANIVFNGSVSSTSFAPNALINTRNMTGGNVTIVPNLTGGDTIQLTVEGTATENMLDYFNSQATIVFDNGQNLYVYNYTTTQHEIYGASLGHANTLFVLLTWEAQNVTTGQKYLSATEAIAEASADDEIRLLKNTRSAIISVPLTLDLNGFAFTNVNASQDKLQLQHKLGDVIIKNGKLYQVEGYYSATGDRATYFQNVEFTNASTSIAYHTCYFEDCTIKSLQIPSSNRGHYYVSGSTKFTSSWYLRDLSSDYTQAVTINTPNNFSGTIKAYTLSAAPTASNDIIIAQNAKLANLATFAAAQSGNYKCVFDDGTTLKDNDGNIYFSNHGYIDNTIWYVHKDNLSRIVNVNQSKHYGNWSTAQSEANANDTLRLVVPLTDNVTISKALTIDLNEQTTTGTITVNCSSAGNVGFKNGTANTVVTNAGNQAIIRLEGAVVIPSLTLQSSKIAIDHLTDGANVTIVGASNDQVLTTATATLTDLNYIHASGKAVVWDNGTNRVDINNDMIETGTVEANTLQTKSDYEVYNVTQGHIETTLANAVTNASVNDVLRIKKSVSTANTITKNLTVDGNGKTVSGALTISNATVTFTGKTICDMVQTSSNGLLQLSALSEGSLIKLSATSEKQFVTAANQSDLQYLQCTNSSYVPVFDNGSSLVDKDGNYYTISGHTLAANTIWSVAASTKAVARINDVYYTTLSAAVSAVTSGQTITLLADCAGQIINQGFAITMDLNNHALTGTTNVTNVTLMNGTIATLQTNADVTFAGQLIVNNWSSRNGLVALNGLTDGSRIELSEISNGADTQLTTATANLAELQYFEHSNDRYTIIYDDGTKLIDKEGNIGAHSAATHATPVANTLWITNSYAAVNTSTGVAYYELSDAISSAKAGETLVLYKSYSGAALTINKNITINANNKTVSALTTTHECSLTNGTFTTLNAQALVHLSGKVVCTDYQFSSSTPAIDLSNHLAEGSSIALNYQSAATGEIKIADNANNDDLSYFTVTNPSSYLRAFDNGVSLKDITGTYYYVSGHTPMQANTLWLVPASAGNAQAVNSTTGKVYSSVQTALDEGNKGETVVMLVDLDSPNSILTISEGHAVTFDMNGHSLSGSGISSGANLGGILYLQNLTDTVIVKNGTVVNLDGKDGDGTAYTGYVITQNMVVGKEGVWVDAHHLTLEEGTYSSIKNHACGPSKDVYGDVYVKGYETYVQRIYADGGSWVYGGGWIRLRGGFFANDPILVPIHSDVDTGYRCELLSPTVTREGITYTHIVRPILTYDAQGGTCAEADNTIKNPYQTLDEMLLELPTPTMDDAEFIGWYTEPTGGVKVTGSSKLAYEPQTIYAHWKTEMSVYRTTWAPDGIVLATPEDEVISSTEAQVTIGEGTPTTNTITQVGCNLYKVALSYANNTHAGESLRIEIEDDEVVYQTRIPYMVGQGGTLTTNMPVVVPDGQAWTVNSTITLDTVEIYGSAKAQLSANVTAANLVLRANGPENKYPQVEMNGGAFVVPSNTFFFDYELDVAHMYTFAATSNVTNTDLFNLNLRDNDFTLDTHYYVDYYLSTTRETTGTGWNYFEGGILNAMQGYTIAAEQEECAFGFTNPIVRMPMAYTDGTKTVEVQELPATEHDNAGWNLLGNPYLSTWYGGHSVASGNTFRYMTIPTNIGSYSQVKAEDVALEPFHNFFIQSDRTVNFTFSLSKSATAPARSSANEQRQECYVGISLSNGIASDKTEMLLGDAFNDTYEVNADLLKMYGQSDAVVVYTLLGDTKLAYNATSNELAEQMVPVGYAVKNYSPLTFSALKLAANKEYKELTLIDNEEGVETNLLNESYTFTPGSLSNNQRFALRCVRIKGTPTSVEVNSLGNYIPQDAQVTVYDALGRVVEVDVQAISTLSKGIYMVQVQTNNGTRVLKLGINQ